MANIVLKNYDGADKIFEGVDRVKLNIVGGGTQIFSEGEVLEGLTLELDLADGDQIVTAPEGMLVKSATILKPDTLKPENIVKDVEIAGVVGTSEGGGDVGLGLYEPEWIDDVCFWDYDGTLLLHIPLEQAKNLVELPTPPAHSGLIFQEWNYTLEEIRGTKYPIDVGATYTTADGKTHVVLKITNSSYRAVPVCFMQSVAKGVTIDWGDGSTTVSGTSVNTAITLTHTYSAIGTYNMVIEVAEGCTMLLGGNTSSTSFIGANNSNYRRYLDTLHIGDRVSFNKSYATYVNEHLEILTIPTGLTVLPTRAISGSTKLRSVIVPRGVTTIESYAIGAFTMSTNSSYRKWGVLSLPATVTSLAERPFSTGNEALRRICIPAGVTAIPNYCMYGCYNLLRVFMSENVTTFGNYVFYDCYQLPEIVLPQELETIGTNCFYRCMSLKKLTLNNKLRSVGNYFLSHAHGLRELVIPESLVSIGYSYFNDYGALQRIVVHSLLEGNLALKTTNALQEIICTQTTPPPGVNTLLSTSYIRRVYVPDEALETYRTALDNTGTYFWDLRPISEYKGSTPITKP